MKEKRILEALSEVRDEFVEEVDFVNVDSKIGDRKNAAVSTKRYRKIRWVKWLGVAAALVVIVSVGSEYFVPKNSSKNYFSASVTNGMVSLEKEEPLLTKNPYLSGMPKVKYPVYKNLAYVSSAGASAYFSKEELFAMAKEVADKLDTNIIEYSYIDVPYEGVDIETKSDVVEINVKTDLAEIQIMGNGKISIFFHESIPLPEGYHFSDDNTYVEAMELIQYLEEEYNDLLGFENVADDCRIEYDLTGKRSLFYSAYNVAVEEPASITEYCFQNVSFYGDENGLSLIRYGDVRVAAEYLGDYDIISEEEARQRLEEGKYISVMLTEQDVIGGEFSDENIMLVELTYRTGSTCQYYQPYYCFYVEIESNVEGIKNYGTFYVPALTGEDLEKFSEEIY